jgi:hypothetical protein
MFCATMMSQPTGVMKMRTALWSIPLFFFMTACGESDSDSAELGTLDSESQTGRDTSMEAESDDTGGEQDSGSDTSSGSESNTSLQDTEDSDEDFYGLINVALRSDFVLDAEHIGEEEYQDEHLAQIASLMPAFTGSVGNMVIPSPEVTDYEILVLRQKTTSGVLLRIVQFAYNGMTLVNPVIELLLPTDTYKTGHELEVCVGQGVVITAYEFNASFQAECVHAVSGDGTLAVDLAEGLGQIDGGRRQLTGVDIPLYHVTKHHHGDLSSSIDEPACEEQR